MLWFCNMWLACLLLLSVDVLQAFDELVVERELLELRVRVLAQLVNIDRVLQALCLGLGLDGRSYSLHVRNALLDELRPRVMLLNSPLEDALLAAALVGKLKLHRSYPTSDAPQFFHLLTRHWVLLRIQVQGEALEHRVDALEALLFGLGSQAL